MSKFQNIQKFTFYMTELILIIVMIRNAGGTDIIACMDLALCNLLKGDLSRESPTLKSEIDKFYKVAEETLASDKTICETGLEKCIEDVTTMAIDILQFPKKYKNSCNHQSYTRSLFGCKNRINWPKSVANELPTEYTSCRTDCLIDEDKPYNLSNGKMLLDYKFKNPYVTSDDIIFEVSRTKSIGHPRNITHNITAFDEAADGLTWTSIDSCPANTWGNYIEIWVLNVTSEPLDNIIVFCSHLNSDNRHIDIIQTYPDKIKEKQNLTTKANACGTNLIPLRGIKVKKMLYNNKPALDGEVDSLCKDKPTLPPGPGLLDCPNSKAICTIQAKNYIGGGVFPTNIRIGCCDLPPETPPTTTSPTTSPTTTISPSKTTSLSTTTSPPNPEDNSTLVNVYKLQKREFYFWDQVIFNHITRYNRYYSPYNVINETEWITSKCPNGTYVNGIRITNPNSEYFVWRRIMEFAFKCGDSQGGQSTELNIYSRLRNKFGLKDSNVNKTFECIKGYYTTVQFEYYTEKNRSALVHGWGIKMECSINGKIEEHNYVLDFSSAANVLSETVKETAKDDCGAKSAICGFNARLSDERIGCFEGFLLKTICCKI